MTVSLKSRLMQLGRHRLVARSLRAIVPMDKRVTELSGGRVHLIPQALVPQLTLITIGRKSGQPRSTPLLYVRDGADFVIVGSNFGQEHHPGWTYNLDASPEAEVLLGTQRIGVRASQISEADRQRLWPSITAMWPAFDNYVQWAQGRTIKLYRLTPQ